MSLEGWERRRHFPLFLCLVGISGSLRCLGQHLVRFNVGGKQADRRPGRLEGFVQSTLLQLDAVDFDPGKRALRRDPRFPLALLQCLGGSSGFGQGAAVGQVQPGKLGVRAQNRRETLRVIADRRISGCQNQRFPRRIDPLWQQRDTQRGQPKCNPDLFRHGAGSELCGQQRGRAVELACPIQQEAQVIVGDPGNFVVILHPERIRFLQMSQGLVVIPCLILR
jgi:hypothetical protein